MVQSKCSLTTISFPQGLFIFAIIKIFTILPQECSKWAWCHVCMIWYCMVHGSIVWYMIWVLLTRGTNCPYLCNSTLGDSFSLENNYKYRYYYEVFLHRRMQTYTTSMHFTVRILCFTYFGQFCFPFFVQFCKIGSSFGSF